MATRYENRVEAGQQLAESLQHLAARDPLVLALPRGGVPVAFQVAQVLNAELDVLLVRKLGVPGHEELAFGAIATGGARVMNDEVVAHADLTEAAIERVVQREREELQRREQAYRDDRAAPEFTERHVIVVDDGLATGATMSAGVRALRAQRTASITTAVPVGPPDAVNELAQQADEVICPSQPMSFAAIGQWYVDFSQTTDQEVRELLKRNWEQAAGRAGS